MPQLEKIVNGLAAEVSTTPDGIPFEVNKDFRLLLSSMPTDVFPVSVSTQNINLAADYLTA